MGCLYWILIGWWLEPIKLVFKLMGGLTSGIIKIILYTIALVIILEIIVGFAGTGIVVIVPIAIILFIIKIVFRKKENNNKQKTEEIQNGKAENEPKTIKEKIYTIKNTVIQFTVNENNELSVLIVDAQDEIMLACIFFYLYIELRDKHKEIPNYKISTVYQGKTVNCENEYIYGNNLDGTISRTTPDWLEKAREDLLETGIKKYSDVILEIEKFIDDFTNGDVGNTKNKYSDEYIENYARQCNAWLEHQDETEQYKIPYEKEQEKTSIQKEDLKILLEKEFFIKENFIQFKYTINNKIEIISICKDSISAANVYLGFYTKLKEDWIGKFDFSVVVSLNEKMAFASHEDNTELFGGTENGENVVGIPRWIDEARNELLSEDQIEFFIGVKQLHVHLEKFIQEISEMWWLTQS